MNLGQKIHDAITERVKEGEGCADSYQMDTYGSALLAVLAVHQPRPIDGHKPDGPQFCPNCVGHFEEFADYPCPTVAALAAALGVSA